MEQVSYCSDVFAITPHFSIFRLEIVLVTIKNWKLIKNHNT